MATSPKAAPAGQADPPAKSNKMLFILLGAVLLVLLAGGGAAAYFLMGSKAEHSEQPKQAPAKPPVFMTLEPFTVNLASDDGSQQFLQVGMTLQVADQAQSDLIKLYLPQVRSRVLMLLSSKKAAQILTIDGKKQLSTDVAEQIKDTFDGKSSKADVSDVFFTSFVIQ
jgi:flagellar FliL protein